MSVFELDHVFVVFAFGAGGNWLTNLLQSIDNGTNDPIQVGPLGSSHYHSNNKNLKLDSIACGSSSEENASLQDIDMRFEFYKNSIVEEYGACDRRIITWTHDYSNIPLYKKYFPNSRVLAITTASPEEQLTAVLMHSTKVLMNPNEADIPLPIDIWKTFSARLNYRIREVLTAYGISDQATISDIIDGRFDEYSDVYLVLSVRELLKYVQNNSPIKLSEYIESADVKLPYSYLKYSHKNLLVHAISSTLKLDLTPEQIEYITIEFDRYKSKQNQKLLDDPKGYLNQKKILVERELKLLSM